MAQDDKYYIERCLDGHPDDFRHLIRRYQGPLLAHLAGQLGNRDLAEEAAQETLVRAYFGLNRLKKHKAFFSWLLSTASHVAKNHLRSEQRRRQREQVHSMYQQAYEAELSQDFALEQAIGQLPDSLREVVLLKYYGRCTCALVAEQLDMPLGTVTKTLSRAYTELRKNLQQEENENEV